MIFKLSHLEGIKAGRITLAFRKWKKPTVRKGSQIRTEMAVVEILDISEIALEDISERDAVKAGFEGVADLLSTLNLIEEGIVYRIKVRYYSEDPRLALRNRTALTDKDFEDLKKKLERLDRNSKEGSWTLTVLTMIKNNPRLRAVDLAIMMNKEKDALKINIRKLKNLGLTISHEVGYTLSPLGEHVLKKIIGK
jgi:hypothetical protein